MLFLKYNLLNKNPVRKGVPTKAKDPIKIIIDETGKMWSKPPILRKSCSSLKPWMTQPALKNNKALKTAWLARWNIETEKCDKPLIKIIYPSWLHVE